MINKTHVIAAAIALSALVLRAREMPSVSAITPDQIGEFITLKGTSTAYYPPKEPKAPYAFVMQDHKGTPIRVVAWPDIFEQVTDRQLLATSGTVVAITAEVSEYRGKLELRLQDWEEVTITPATSSSLQSRNETRTTGALATTKPLG